MKTRAMTAEILCVGTELLMGQIENTNAQFLAQRLSALGVSLYHQTVVGDNVARLEEAYRLALSRADVVITTGGLGPTLDDITKSVAAKALGKELVLHPEGERMVRDRFAKLGLPMTENNFRQAMFTPDTMILKNPNGTAPGAIVPSGDGKVIVHLPGPPVELGPMFDNQVAPYLRQRSALVLESRYIRIFGMGESQVDELLSDLETGGNPTLSPYCSLGEVMLRATAQAATKEGAEALLQPLVEKVKGRLGQVIYMVSDHDDGSLAKAAVDAMKEKGLTCTLAESLTGGMAAAALVGVPGASNVLKGSFVTYTEEAKHKMIGVPLELIKKHGVVSHECAKAMAKGAREALSANLSISMTGLAGPGGGGDKTPVGTVFLGLSTPKGEESYELHLIGDRQRVRTLTVLHALNRLRLAAIDFHI